MSNTHQSLESSNSSGVKDIPDHAVGLDLKIEPDGSGILRQAQRVPSPTSDSSPKCITTHLVESTSRSTTGDDSAGILLEGRAVARSANTRFSRPVVG